MPSLMRKATTPGSLYRLIYRSREVIAQVCPDALSQSGLDDELRRIVSGARQRNQSDAVTGALLYADGGFAQVIEGAREIVERTFDRIALDRRHTDVTVLCFTPTQRRSFPDWPLAFCPRIPAPSTVQQGTSIETGDWNGPRTSTASDVLHLLERLVQQVDTQSEDTPASV
jgi:blue light- and temperature-responsive anti-repressor